MDIRYYIGIDVSKNTLDWAIYADQRTVWQTQSENSSVAIRAVIRQIRPYQALVAQPVSSVWSIPRGGRRPLQCPHIGGAVSGSISDLARGFLAY
jgi:hypothetical protein